MGRRGQELSPERQDRAIREMYGGFNDHSPLPDLVGLLEGRQAEAVRGQQQGAVLGSPPLTLSPRGAAGEATG